MFFPFISYPMVTDRFASPFYDLIDLVPSCTTYYSAFAPMSYTTSELLPISIV
jgi:hypothetical protein